MLNGRFFRLRNPVLAVEVFNGRRTAINVPPDSILRTITVSHPAAGQMIDVQWRDKHLVMFAVDIEERSDEIELAEVRANPESMEVN